MGLTTKVLLNKVRKKKDGTYPLVIRVTLDSKVIYIPLGFTLLEQDWNAKNQEIKPACKIIDNTNRTNNEIRAKVARVYDLYTELESSGEIHGLSMTEFKSRVLKERRSGQLGMLEFINLEIDRLHEAGKDGNARIYKTLRNKLATFIGKGDIAFNQINYNFLIKLETAHFKSGGDIGGLSVYMRTLRAVYNKAIKQGLVKKEYYPFDDYKIRNKKPVHKALSQDDFEKLVAYEPEKGSPFYRDKNLFMSSFYLRGMNWMDMAYVTGENIVGDFKRLQYVRKKTGEPFNIKISDKLRAILIEFVGGKPKKLQFIFPIIPQDQKESQHAMTIRNKRQRLNKRLKTIAEQLNIESFTIYTARHTYATMAKRKGVPTAVIQESLGHSTESMTQTYLDSFENSVVDQYDELIMGK